MKADQIITFIQQQGYISQREGKIMRAAISDRAVAAPVNMRNEIRAGILKAMLLSAYAARE